MNIFHDYVAAHTGDVYELRGIHLVKVALRKRIILAPADYRHEYICKPFTVYEPTTHGLQCFAMASVIAASRNKKNDFLIDYEIVVKIPELLIPRHKYVISAYIPIVNFTKRRCMRIRANHPIGFDDMPSKLLDAIFTSFSVLTAQCQRYAIIRK